VFDAGDEAERTVDGQSVPSISPNLRGGLDTTTAKALRENDRLAYMGDTKGGAFDLELEEARKLLAEPNPNGKPPTDVVLPWVNGSDVTKRGRSMFIVDFGTDTTESNAAGYAAAFSLMDQRVRPERACNRRVGYALRWWLHVEPRPAMRAALPKTRFIVTPNVTKHRVFVWPPGHVLPDHQLIAFARSDDYMFGVLHSAAHELWARCMGTQLREAESGFRYTPTSCFGTFPSLGRRGRRTWRTRRTCGSAMRRRRWTSSGSGG
jgi:type II restriction/modification system DNA methylase subunit YeeA